VRDVLAAAATPQAELSWVEINRLAARRLRPDSGDTSRLGHAFVLELAASGLVEAEVTQAADGTPMVALARGRRAPAPAVERPMAA
jgi:hypothetical protein